MKLEIEKDEIRKQEEEYLKKEKELAEKELLEPWNVDTIGHEAFSSSVYLNSFFLVELNNSFYLPLSFCKEKLFPTMVEKSWFADYSCFGNEEWPFSSPQ